MQGFLIPPQIPSMKTLFSLLSIIVAMIALTSCGSGQATEVKPNPADSIIVIRAQSMIDNTIAPIYVLKKNYPVLKADDLVWVDSINMFITPAKVLVNEEAIMCNRLIKYRILIQ